jgi:hypothetical protein
MVVRTKRWKVGNFLSTMGRIAGDGIVSEQTIAAVVRPELDFGIALELGFILRRNGESGGSDSWSIVEPRVAAVAGTGNEQRRMHEIFEDDGFVFTRRVCRAVEEREIARVLLQQLGIDVQTEDESTWRREDAIALQDLVQIRRRLRERMSCTFKVVGWIKPRGRSRLATSCQ